MKKMSFTVLFSLLSTLAFAGTPVLTLVPVDNVYSPEGFDSNDPDAQVIVSGYLPNLCHKKPSTEVKIDGNKIDIKLSALRYDATNPFCAEVIVPFVETVSLGILDKGQYQVTVNGKSLYEKKAELTVNESTSAAVDDYTYARVEYIEKEYGSRVVKLKGYNPSDCFELKEIKVISNKKDAYSVLPIMKQVSSHCPMKMVPFEYDFYVPSELKKDTVLLHVRSMDGNSVNTLFSNF